MTRDHLGKRGESIVCSRLMEYCGQPEPYFDPHPLGEKCPTFDYLVELVNAGDSPPYFLAQVKTTQKKRTKATRRLRVEVSADDVRRMARCPLPTYLLGVFEPRGQVYILAIQGAMKDALPSIPTTYPLTPRNLRRLWEEVRSFWGKLDPAVKSSAFSIKG